MAALVSAPRTRSSKLNPYAPEFFPPNLFRPPPPRLIPASSLNLPPPTSYLPTPNLILTSSSSTLITCISEQPPPPPPPVPTCPAIVVSTRSSRLPPRRRNYDDRCYQGRFRGGGGGRGRSYAARRSFRPDSEVKWVERNGYSGGGRRCAAAGESSSFSKRKGSSPLGLNDKWNKATAALMFPVDPDGRKTSVMIRNIPNRYTRELMIEFLDKHCMSENLKENMSSEKKIVSAYDFLYLPMDFLKGANKGYAFVNFTDPRAVWKFYEAENNQKWDRFGSTKIRQIVYARVQGKHALVTHFNDSNFECENDEYLPVCFSPPRDGRNSRVRQRILGNRPRFGGAGGRSSKYCFDKWSLSFQNRRGHHHFLVGKRG